MTTLFEDDDDTSASAEAETEIELPDPSISERSLRAQAILDEIGLIDLDIPHGVYTNAVEFVADMQERLEDARARKRELFCSERQLEWLEAIYEKVG